MPEGAARAVPHRRSRPCGDSLITGTNPSSSSLTRRSLRAPKRPESTELAPRSSSPLDDGPGLDLDPGTERERGRREGGPCWERRAKELSVGTIEGWPIREVSQVHIDFDDLLSRNTGVGEDVAEVAERLLELGPEAALDHLPVVAQADLTGRGDRLSNPTPWAERSDRLCHESLLLYFVSGCGTSCATPRPKDQFSRSIGSRSRRERESRRPIHIRLPKTCPSTTASRMRTVQPANCAVGARWASPLPKETLARPISEIRTNTSSSPTTPAATRLRLISASNDFLTPSSRPSRKVISTISNWSV